VNTIDTQFPSYIFLPRCHQQEILTLTQAAPRIGPLCEVYTHTHTHTHTRGSFKTHNIALGKVKMLKTIDGEFFELHFCCVRGGETVTYSILCPTTGTTMGTGSFPGVEAAGTWDWPPHPNLVPKVLEKNRDIPLLTLRAFVEYRRVNTNYRT